jgi:TPR repeat protein
MPAVVLLTLVPMAPESWFEAPSWTYLVAIAVGSAIFVQLSNLYERRVQKRVASKYHLLAESGDAIAMCYLGLFYKAGAKGLRRDDEQAVRWLRRAAASGDGMAMYHLGLYYDKGDAGLPQAGVEALNWYLKAANAGSTSAMNNIGYLYEYGACGVTRDNSEARNWYAKAANLGNTLALENLELLQQKHD